MLLLFIFYLQDLDCIHVMIVICFMNWRIRYLFLKKVETFLLLVILMHVLKHTMIMFETIVYLYV